MPRIIFVTNSLRVGGSQSVLLELVDIAVVAGWDVVVASKGGPLRRAFTDQGAVCVDLLMREGVAPRPSSALSPLEAAKTGVSLVAGLRLARLASGPVPTLVQASQPWPLALAALASRRTRRPLLWHVHGTSAVEMPPPFPNAVARQLTGVVAVTPEVGLAVAPLVGDVPVHVLPNPVALGDFRVRDMIERPLAIGTCATLSANKSRGVAVLIDAAAALSQDRPVRLAIVGDGPERAGLEQHARAAAEGRSLDVSFLGERAEPWEALSDCTVVVGVGLVAVEAALRGHRVVVAGTDGLGGVLTEANASDLYRTNYTGRDIGPLDADGLAVALAAACRLDPSDVVRLRDELSSRHGRPARERFERLWTATLAGAGT